MRSSRGSNVEIVELADAWLPFRRACHYAEGPSHNIRGCELSLGRRGAGRKVTRGHSIIASAKVRVALEIVLV